MMALERNGLNDLESTWYEFVRQHFYKVVKWFHRQEDQKMLFIFVGLEKSGKTTAIQNMLGKPEKYERSSVSLYANLGTQITSPREDVTILDVRSLSSLKMVDKNSQLLASLKKYLKSKSFVPTVVFMTARLTDERFAGESSEYRMALKSLSLLRNELTDISCSNVVLLLTFGDELGIRNQRFQRVEAYKKAFQAVYGTSPFTLILENTPISLTQSMLQIPDKKDHKISCFQGLFLDYINSLPETHVNSLGAQIVRTLANYEAHEVKLDYVDKEHEKILQALRYWNGEADRLQIINYSSSSQYDVNVCATAVIPTDYLTASSFGENYRYEPDIIQNNVYNLIPRSASILLEDGKYTPIQNCMIGQKIYSVGGGTSVVTKSIQIFGSILGKGFGPIQFGSVYMKADNDSDKIQNYSGNTYTTVPKADRFSLGKISNLSYFYIEVNGGNYPFVVDKHVCFSYCKSDFESDLHTITCEDILEASNYCANTQ